MQQISEGKLKCNLRGVKWNKSSWTNSNSKWMPNREVVALSLLCCTSMFLPSASGWFLCQTPQCQVRSQLTGKQKDFQFWGFVCAGEWGWLRLCHVSFSRPSLPAFRLFFSHVCELNWLSGEAKWTPEMAQRRQQELRSWNVTEKENAVCCGPLMNC